MRTLHITNNIMEAEVLKAYLQDNEIGAFLQQDTGGGMRPSLAFTSGVQVLVNDSDFDRANEILQDFLENQNENFDDSDDQDD